MRESGDTDSGESSVALTVRLVLVVVPRRYQTYNIIGTGMGHLRGSADLADAPVVPHGVPRFNLPSQKCKDRDDEEPCTFAGQAAQTNEG